MATFVVDTTFRVEQDRRPSPRQFEALFHRLDYAVLDAQVLVGGQGPSGWPPRRVAREMLLREPEPPHIVSFSYENPIFSSMGDGNRLRAAALLVFISLNFNAVEKAERGLAGAIDGATEIVRSAEGLWDELESSADEDRLEASPMQIVIHPELRAGGPAQGSHVSSSRPWSFASWSRAEPVNRSRQPDFPSKHASL